MIKLVIKIIKNYYFWLAIVLIIGFAVRLYKIDNPIADWHSWRQADTAAVARNFYKEGFNLFIPKYDDMSGVAEDPVANPHRYRFVEFPIYNSIVYFFYLLNGGVDEKLARLVSILFSLGSTVFLFFISKKYFGQFTALMSSLLFAVLPFNIYFSRVILPEPTLVFFCLGMFYFVDEWILKGKKWHYPIALFFTVCAFLIKPVAIFYLLPLIYSVYQKEGKLWPIPRRYIIFLLLSLTPLLLWRVWIMQHPEGIPASNWLLNGNGIRFRPAFWRWILGERLGGEILSVTGIVLFFIGFLKRPDANEKWLMHLLAMSSLLFLVVFATGNVQHDYYQTFIVPALVVFVAYGFTLLIRGTKLLLPRIITIPFAILFLILTPYLGWDSVKGLYQINNPSIVEAGKVADRVLPKDAIVVAPYNGDTAFLYQVNRGGWPYVAVPVTDLIKYFGVTHYVSVNYDAKTKWVIKQYQPLVLTEKFAIVDLTKINPLFDSKAEPEP